MTLYTKYLPPYTQKEQNSEIKDKGKEKKNDSNEKSEGMLATYIM